ncbi:site-specific DNA-methyltransferase [Luteolibacter sp. SL250]|uniref:site-specific DNA-methyltransferase n=1 Tax=Luteolibacter sp. SL250 TaxID=2995170 RepID=UPI00226EF30C|nr:site-specific DNA-methyltransferase [Luteolibacter sp. SL250]WAC18093.1 site-specific DNA-methyltransferase [Luteolibacter sp. SL250]
MDRLDLQTPDLTARNVDQIAALFPNCVTETTDADGKTVRAIDFDLLRQELSRDLVEGPQERYRLDWPGKRAALALANSPIDRTLRPARQESVDFDTTGNLYIEGDNLDALKLLQESYPGKVRVIYTDPPYNTGNDFIYDDDFSMSREEYARGSGEPDEEDDALSATNGRTHSGWLSMMYPRLKLARNLLADDGVIFISIGDDEIANLKKLCNEVFGSDNFISQVTRIAKRTSDKGTHFRPTKDYILAYAKSIRDLPEFGVRKVRDIGDYTRSEKNGRRYKKSGASLFQPSLDSRPNQRYYIEAPDGSLIIPPGNVFPEERKDGAKVKPLSNADKVWRWSVDTYLRQRHLLIFTPASTRNPLLDEHGRQSKWNIYPKVYFDEDVQATLHPEDVIYDYPNSQGTKELKALGIPFPFCKPTELVAFLLRLIDGRDAIVLDFFSGSATTAHAVMKLNAEDGGNRRHIMVQLAEPCDDRSDARKAGYTTIAEIGKERLRRAGKKVLEEWKSSRPPGETPPDTGFRVLKVESDSRTDEDLLFQVMLGWGVELGLPIREETLAGKEVFFVAENALAACFATGVDEALIRELAERQPLRMVFRDTGFSSDVAKMNAARLFKSLSPRTELRAL